MPTERRPDSGSRVAGLRPRSGERIGIVDLGSNTARLVVYEHEPGSWYRLVDEIREPVRLGEGIFSTGRLSPEAMERAEAALGLYADYARATGLPRLEVIATSAVRDAANRDELMHPLAALDLSLQVLSGEDEAALGALAVANSLPLRDAWVVDLGGGSAQVALLRDREAVRCSSYALGGVRLREGYLTSDPPRSGEISRLEEAIGEAFGDLPAELRALPFPLVAMGGTARNLARAIQHEIHYPVDLVHGFYIDREHLELVVERLLALPAAQRRRIRGIHPDRADVVHAGALVFRWLVRSSESAGLWVSGQGVREGMFYRLTLPAPHIVPEVRTFSLSNLASRFPQPPEHVERVRFLARRIFDALRPLHPWGESEAELLDAAAAVHDAGASIAYFDHHKHGEYLLSSAALPGFSHREQALLALLVRFHRKGTPKAGIYRPLLEKSDRSRLPALATCLRLAESCERSRAGRIEDVEVEIELGDKRVTLYLVASEEPRVELWEARKHATLFRRAFGRRLEVRARVSGAG